MSVTYKLVVLDISGIKRFTAKYSPDKPSVPAPSSSSATCAGCNRALGRMRERRGV